MTATWTALDGTVHPLTAEARLQAAKVYIALFSARTDAWGAWGGSHWITACSPGCPRCSWLASHRGEDAPAEVPAHARAPLTPAVIVHAAASGRPVSAYMIAPDSTTHVLALDVDREDGLGICIRVGEAMRKAGLPAYVEPSRRGGHLWVTLTRPVPAIAARRALRAFLQAVGAPDDPKIELRPAQDRVSPDGVGHCLRMPLMPHQSGATYAREVWDSRGRIVANSIVELVQGAEEASADVVLEWAERWSPPLDPRAIPPAYRKPRRYEDDASLTATSLLAEAGVPRAHPGRAVLCPFHDDHNPSLSIARDDTRVFCKSPSCEAHNGGRGLGTNQLRNLIRRRNAA